MKIFNNTSISTNYKGSAIAIGNFDGVHKGHQKVFLAAKRLSKKKGIKFGILTFNPLPVMFFNKKVKNYKLTSQAQKINLLKPVYFDTTFYYFVQIDNTIEEAYTFVITYSDGTKNIFEIEIYPERIRGIAGGRISSHNI